MSTRFRSGPAPWARRDRSVRRSARAQTRDASDTAEVRGDAQATDIAVRPVAAVDPSPRNERPILRVGRALVVVPSVRPSQKAWRKLGFTLTDAFEFMGCSAFDLVLAGCGVRFLALPKRAEPNPLTQAIGERLENGGAGLLGWTWACQSVYRSRDVVEERTGSEFAALASGRKAVVVPRKLSPGATTLLEPLVHEEVPRHLNRAVGLDHMVVTVSNVDAAADTYERAFGLSARRDTIADRRYAFLKVGDVGGSTIEVVGPVSAGAGANGGHGWGLAFRTDDLDTTVRALRVSGVPIGDVHDALQGGRIASLPMQVGGVQIAFIGN